MAIGLTRLAGAVAPASNVGGAQVVAAGEPGGEQPGGPSAPLRLAGQPCGRRRLGAGGGWHRAQHHLLRLRRGLHLGVLADAR